MSIDFIVEGQNSQDASKGTIKNEVEKETTVIPETNCNKLEFKAKENVDINNEKKKHSRKATNRYV